MIFPKQVSAARALIGWSQPDLAREAGLSVRTIKYFEAGQYASDRTVKAIRAAFSGRVVFSKRGVSLV